MSKPNDAPERSQQAILRRIAERGLRQAQDTVNGEFIDVFQHLIDEIARLDDSPELVRLRRIAELTERYLCIEGIQELSLSCERHEIQDELDALLSAQPKTGDV